MKGFILSILLASSLTGCAVWDWLKPASDGISVDAEMTIGDKHEEIASGVVVGKKEETHNTADAIHQTFNTVTEQNNWFPYLLAMLFLMLPTPTRMWQGMKKAIINLIEWKRQ